MRKGIEERCVQVGRYLFENSSTVRATAKAFQMSKTTVHKDLVIRLPKVHPQLAKEVQEVLATNKRERSTRGGNATRKKYLSLKVKGDE